MEITLLKELVIVFALAIAVLTTCHRLYVPPIVGFLLTGILAGPHGLALVGSVHEIELLAEIGIALLLFVIGTEFSLSRLLQLRRLVLIGGAVQLLLTSLASFAAAKFFGVSTNAAVLLGFLISFSSTALVLKVLQERAEIDSPFGRTAFAVLIFQDLAIIPVMILIPLLGGQIEADAWGLFLLFLKGTLIVGLGGICAMFLVPKIFMLVAKTRDQELFLLTVVVVCFAVAFGAQAAGLSLAIGALLAGLIISESDYSHQALSKVLPFQQVFTSLFFISVGMLLDVEYVLEHPWGIAVGAAVIIIGKSLLAVPSALALGFSLRSGLRAGLALGQIGEFSFVAASAGLAAKVITSEHYNMLLAVSVISMAFTPLMIAKSQSLASLICRWRFLVGLQKRFSDINEHEHLLELEQMQNHVLILGMGVNGQLAARAAQRAGIPFAAIDLNPERIKTYREKGLPVIYGDACQEAVMHEAGIERARIAIVGVSDFMAARKIVELYRRVNPNLYVIVRTHFNNEIDQLYKLGAHEVISEEYESAVEVASRLMTQLLQPRNEIEQFLKEVRGEGYQMIRTPNIQAASLLDLELHGPDIDLFSLRLGSQSTLIGKTLEQAELRQRFGVNLLLIKRGEEVTPSPASSTIFYAGDILVFLGPVKNRLHLEQVCGI